MGRIQVLPDSLINRIAAGEVVERPGSVVKELLENSLDAGCSLLDVRLAGAGKQCIELSDDGCGMDRDDALLCLERHATSKLARVQDLEAISSLGFRGEALSSIAAVSLLNLKTATRDGEGTEIDVRGGRIERVRPSGLPRGTSIRVERLFFNVPARRKFLRADASELTHAVRWVTRYALAHPSVRFQLRHQGRSLLDAAPAGRRLERIRQLFGHDLSAKLLPFAAERDQARLQGYAGRPVDSRPRGDALYLFVNGRPVQDRLLAHAALQAYGNSMPAGRQPVLFLFLELAPGLVDVNVHPQKLEVRFHRPGEIHDWVGTAVRSALSQDQAVSSLTELRPSALPIAGKNSGQDMLVVCEGPAEPAQSADWPAGDPNRVQQDRGPLPKQPLRLPLEGSVAGERSPGPAAQALAQLRNSYILAEDQQGLVLVDQHAAHERILFERYLADAEANRVDPQRLLFPVTLELAPHEWVALEQATSEFMRLGFLLEPFGTGTVRLDSVPALAADVDAGRLVRELLGESARTKAAAADIPSLRRRLVTTAACHAAIKVPQPLQLPAMQAILDDLGRTVNPTTCPHGRPVLFRLTLEEIERTFRRR